MSKTTSLVALTEALHDYGWTVEVKDAPVRVPDPDSPHVIRSGYSGRARYTPTKTVPGVVVTARNGDKEAPQRLSAQFTAEGKYLAKHTSGGYPFSSGMPLKEMLAKVATYGPQVIAERRAQRQAEETRSRAEEAQAVREAYAEAKEALVAAQHEAFNLLAEDAGLSTAQAEAVLVMFQTGKFGPLLDASAQVERIGKGWLPGKSYVSGTYVDGVLVSD